MGLRRPFRIVGRFFARRRVRHMGRRCNLWDRWGGLPGRKKSGRPRNGPGSALVGGARHKKARALDGRGMLQRRLPRADVPRAVAAWFPRLRAFKDAEAWFVGAGRGACGSARPSMAGKAALNNYHSPTCVRLVDSSSNACPQPAGACIVLPRAAPRRAAARTPRTGYCGRRRRSDRPFRTGLQRWLEIGREAFRKPPSFMNSLNPFFSTYKVLIWTESSILAQDERWRRA